MRISSKLGIILVAMLLLALPLLAACGGDDDTEEPTAPATEPTAPATEPTAPATEPTAPVTEPAGDLTWVLDVSYDGTSEVHTATVIGEEAIEGTDCYVAEWAFDVQPFRYDAIQGYPLKTFERKDYIAKDTMDAKRNSVLLEAAGMIELQVTKTLTYTGDHGQPYSFGDMYQFDDYTDLVPDTLAPPYTDTVELEVVAIEDVTVPAGTFRCYKLEYTKVATDGEAVDRALLHHDWWSAEYDLLTPVKVVEYATYQAEEVKELASYDPMPEMNADIPDIVGGEGPTTEPTAEPEEKKAYKIGAVLSVTGPASSLGIPEENTAKMMEDEINAAGGINGHPIEVIIYDTETSAEKCATLTTRLIEQDNVLAIMGPTTSGNSMAIIDIVTNAEIPLVSCAAAISIVTPVEERYWIFKTPQTEKEAVTEIYTHMQTNEITKVALITDTSGFGAAGLAFLKADAEGYGIDVVEKQTFDSGDTSMEAQLTNIMGSDAEAVICWATTDESATVALDMQNLGIEIPLYCSHGIANMDFIDQAGDAANGVIFPAGKLLFVNQVQDTDPQKQVLINYIADYEAINGEGTMSTFGGHLYDALSMIAITLEDLEEGASTAEARTQIRDGLEQITEFAGTGGVFTMSPENHLGMAPGSLGMIEIVDSAWTLAP